MQAPNITDPQYQPSCTAISNLPTSCSEWTAIPSNGVSFAPLPYNASFLFEVTEMDATLANNRLLLVTLQDLGCGKRSQPTVRYSNSFSCSILFEPCFPSDSQRLCRDICSQFYGDIFALLRNADMCEPAVEGSEVALKRSQFLSGVASWCSALKPIEGCLGGSAVDYTTCGYGHTSTSQEQITQLCSSSKSDPCCRNVVNTIFTTQSPSPNSGSASANVGPSQTTIRVAITGLLVAFMFIITSLMILRIFRPWTTRGPRTPTPSHLESSKPSEIIDSRPTKSFDSGRRSISNLDIGQSYVDDIKPRVSMTMDMETDRSISLSMTPRTVDMHSEKALCYARASRAFKPTRADEISLKCGDAVQVHCVFEDGWAYGLNKTTNALGTFPVVAISLL